MKRKILTVIFFVFSCLSYSQNNQIDSLIKLLDRPDDSLKVINLIDIYQAYQNGDILTGKKYLDQAKKIAEKIDMNVLKVSVNLNYGIIQQLNIIIRQKSFVFKTRAMWQ